MAAHALHDAASPLVASALSAVVLYWWQLLVHMAKMQRSTALQGRFLGVFAFANLFLTLLLAARVLAGLAASRGGSHSEELVARAARGAFGASGTVSVVEGLAYVVFGTRLVKRIGGKPGGNDKSIKIVHISARCGGALFLRGALALAIAIAPHETLLSSAQGALWLALLAPQILEIGVVLCLTWESACAPAFCFNALFRRLIDPVRAVRPRGSVLERASFLALVRHSISGTSLLDAENVRRGSFAVFCGMFYVFSRGVASVVMTKTSDRTIPTTFPLDLIQCTRRDAPRKRPSKSELSRRGAQFPRFGHGCRRARPPRTPRYRAKSPS